VIDRAAVPVSRVAWTNARRVIRSSYPPIDLFDDIAPPEDWAILIAAEQKTNPRLVMSSGPIDLIPKSRRKTGSGASFLMAPFTHVSTDRPSRFSDGTYGVLYAAKHFDTALLETMYHHGHFMARTRERAGWTSQFRELVLNVKGSLHDLRGGDPHWRPALNRQHYSESQRLGRALREASSDGVVYPSQRDPAGECVGLFYPDLAAFVKQARHLDYHWDGDRVDLYRDAGSGQIFRVQ